MADKKQEQSENKQSESWITPLHELWFKDIEQLEKECANLKAESDDDTLPELSWEKQQESRKKRAAERAAGKKVKAQSSSSYDH